MSADAKTVEARCVRLSAEAENAAALAPTIERQMLARGPNDLLIEVKAAAVNPSDVKAATGLMPYAVFPRTPGRDYAGVVIDGPAAHHWERSVRLVRGPRHSS
ncbi:NADPH:quinone reductase-like Zn-dependent oxidoreductase [Bradyrhizobium yuanmingense]